MTSNVANISQRAALAAVAGPLDEVHEMRKAFDARRRAIVTALNDIEGVNCPTPTGAFYAFADIAALLGKPLVPRAQCPIRPLTLPLHCWMRPTWPPSPARLWCSRLPAFLLRTGHEDLAEGMRRFKEWAN